MLKTKITNYNPSFCLTISVSILMLNSLYLNIPIIKIWSYVLWMMKMLYINAYLAD